MFRYGPEVTFGDDVDWSAKYFYDDPCLRYIAIDPKKRGVQVFGFVIGYHNMTILILKINNGFLVSRVRSMELSLSSTLRSLLV